MRMNAINAILVTTAVTLLGQGLHGAEFYVAPNGDDANPGTKARPFASVERARDEVRALKKAGPPPGAVTVQVRGGTYFLRDTLVFDPEDSGTEQAPVIYQAYPGEEPLLSGGVTVSGWREVTPGRWQTTLPDVAAGAWWFSQLYVNDQRRPRAFLPKQGYYYIHAEAPSTREYGPEGSGKPGSDRFVFREGDIRSDWYNLGDVEITTFHLWTMDRIQVKEVDSVKRLVTLRGPSHSKEQAPLNSATWYRVENVKEALTEPGEWYLDRKSGVLTYLAKPGEDISRATVIAPRLSRLVTFNGDVAGGTFVDHIILRGLTLAHSSWNMPASGYTGHWQADAGLQGAGPGLDGAVTGVNARHCALESCIVRHTGAYAVDFSDGCKSDRVESCELVDLGGGGVKVGPFERDVRKRAEGCTVRDNLIAHGGRVHPASVGVWIGHADRNAVDQNHIADFYYSAMSIGWSWGHDKSADRNLIADNLIENIGQGVLSDMGGIYLLGHAPGTVVRGNVIHDVNRARYGGFGIYLDACSAFVTVENNLVYRTEDASLNQNFGHDNTIRNNVFAYGQHGLLSFSDLKNGATTLEGNIFLLRQGRSFVLQPGGADDKNVYKRNVYWAEKSQDDLTFPGRVKLDQWRLREPDALVADPQFVNLTQDDFRLQPQSPAVTHGFVPRDFGQAGRLSAINRTAKLPAVARVFPPAPPPHGSEAIDEGFEAYAAGQAWATRWPWQVGVAPGSAQSITVTDEVAAGGRMSLKFADTAEGDPWEPSLLTGPYHESGTIRNSFELWMEPGAHMVWEWRDWADELLTGPRLEALPDGVLLASGTKLTTLPHRQWSRLEIVCGVGPQATGSYSVAVTLPGAKEPLRFEALKYPPGFRALNWASFLSMSEAHAIYYVDNLRLAKDPQ